jgi:nitrogen fixation-related uncharacterized protein
MSLVAMVLLVSVMAVPAVALWALVWAGRTGQLFHGDRAALLPFDEDEPVGEPTDMVLNREGKK